MTQREANADLLAEITALRDRVASQSREIAALQGALTQAHAQLSESLEQQIATSEILRVISSSPTDVQSVFDAIAENAARLCESADADIWRRADDQLLLVAHYGAIPVGPVAEFGLPLVRGTVGGRSILEERPIQVADVQAAADEFPKSAENAWRTGHRTILSVPLMREGIAIGTIILRRTEARLFSERQTALLKTFADQAVIAIENVRLFTELQEKNRALTRAHAQVTESLEQQTATSEILRVISSSPTDVQPVFAALATSAARLCEAFDAAIHLVDAEVLRLVAHEGSISPDVVIPLAPETLAGRVIFECRAIHVADMQAETSEYPMSSEFARNRGFRTILSAPLLRGAEGIGTITIRRTEARPFTDKQIALLSTFADQAVIAIENVRLFTELQARNNDLTATGEILQVIASSPTDLEPVFTVIASRALRLCDAAAGLVFRYDGTLIHLAASESVEGIDLQAIRDNFPAPPEHATFASRVVTLARPVYIADIEHDSEAPPGLVEFARANGFRSIFAAPMRHAGHTLGLIAVTHRDVDRFTAAQGALLKTFADQAVVAIENVRLFTELQEKNRALTESLEQQTATSEILRVISSTPTDAQPVFDAVAKSAARLCESFDSAIWRQDGDRLRLVAHHGAIPQTGSESFLPLVRGTVGGRSVLDGRTVHIADIQTEEDEFPETSQNARRQGWRTILSVPLTREGIAIGAIVLRRAEARPFSERQVALLRIFADQAVIAIENVRLFKELEARNHDLIEALDRQTATSEILRVISSSPTDIKPVFDALARSAVRFCGAYDATLFRVDGGAFRVVAHHGPIPFPLGARFPLERGYVNGRSILDRRPVHVTDLQAESEEFAKGSALARDLGQRTTLVVPLMREGEAIGTIQLRRVEASRFTDQQVALLQTFADQAVIAIENVRLFTELQTRTAELTRSVGELRALGEVGQAISSTLDLQTVLQTIVARATEFAGVDAGVIYEYNQHGEIFVPRATEHLEAEIVETLIAAPVRRGEGVTGRLADSHEPIQLSDILQAPPESRVRDTLGRAGYRALLAVPLVREDHLLGGLTVFRKTPGEFSPEVIELLRTFATQSALAIQNARLFREIEAKSRELEVASQHKSEFLANMSHELRTPLNAIIGFSEVLSDRMFGELNEKQEEYLKDIYASGTHLLSLINDILDLSKIEAGRMELELTEFHLPTAIDNALMLVRERAGRRSITLQTNIDDRLGQVQADERKVRQVVLNLLSNAIKFTPEGGRIDVGAEPKDGFVEVSVSDTGIGIAPEDQEKVFEEFRQVGTAAKKIEGTGLGLTLCRKFVELHGGRIWVKSELGQGSTFTFTIPVRHGE